jgi:autotransporter adhesin
MNKSYKSVWNESTGSWVAVSELATGRSKSKRAKTAISKAILTQIAVGGMSLAGASVAMAGDPVKFGTGATVGVADGIAIGTGAEAALDPDQKNAGKTGGIAIGEAAYASGSGVAFGNSAEAGSDSLAFGAGATATNHSTAIGNNAMSFNVNAVALGEGASAGGQGSLALGAGSGVSGSNSVALGQGSVADRDYTVSVGTAASKRQITNVADATHDSDAVTLNQLKSIGVTTDTTGGVTNAFVAYDANSAKAKVSLGGTAGTTLSNVAAGVAATDAVNKGQLDTLSNSISAVAPSLKYLRFGASTAQVANAMGADSVAIGGNSFATQTGSVAIGLFTNVSGTNSVAIGARSTVDGKNSVSLGSNSSTDEDNVISVGSLELQRRITNVGSGTTTTDAVNLGQVEDMITAATKPVQQMVKSTRTLLGAQAAPVLSDLVAVGTTDKLGQTAAIGTDAVAVGLNAQANNDNAVAIGTNVAAGGVGGVAIGNLTTSGGVNATAIGINAQSMGDTSVAIGTGVKSVGTNGVAIGNSSFTGQNATNGVAIGYKNTVTGAGTVALGNQITGTGTNSVVLGSASDGSQSNVVSVGGKGTERKVVNVAAGTTATDAVNFAQLTAATTGIGGDNVAYDSTAHDKVTLGGSAATKTVTLSNVAAGVTTNDAVNMGQLTALGLVVDSTGKAQNAFVAYDNNTSKDTITLKGTSGSTKITALTNGTLSAASTDAVNGSQLFNTASSTAAAIGGGSTLDPSTGTISKPAITVAGTTYTDVAAAVTAAGTAATTAGTDAAAAKTAVVDAVKYDSSAHDKVTLNAGKAPVTLTNVAAGSDTNDAVNFGQLAALGGKVDSNGKALNSFVAYDNTSMDTITLQGVSGTTKITKLTNGTVNATSSDAVNGSQLYNAVSTTAAALGAGATVDPTTGKVTTPKFTVGSTSYDTVQGALAAVATGGPVSPDTVVYDSSAHDKLTFGGTAATKPVTLSNVAAGVTTNDAVNMGQLTALGLVVDSTGKAQNAFVAYDNNTSKDTITLKGTSGSTKITALTNGTLSAASTDAVNGSQLFNTASSTAAAIGGGSTLDPSTGTISKPAITVAGTTYNDVASAVTAAGTAATNAGTDAAAAKTAVGNAVMYDSTAHNKITLGGTSATAPVTLSNVAAGVSATDAVNKAQLDGVTNSVNTIAPALKYLRFGSSTAATANALGTDSIAIGGNAFASQSGSLAIGLFANVAGANSVAFGTRATADGVNSVAIGSNSSADEDNVVSVGSIEGKRRIVNVDAGTNTTDAVNLGQVEDLITAATKPVQQMVKSTRTLLGAQAAPVLSDVVAVGITDKLGQAEANGTDAVAIGLGAHANNDNTVAIGTNVAAGGIGGVAIGNLATSGGLSATAIGVNAQSMGDTSVAIGTAVKTVGTNGVAIGNGSFTGQNASNSVAIGFKNTVTGAGTVVLGNQVTSIGTNSVVLGSGSDGSLSNVVSVGAKGTERKIVNVAAGTTTTDAVNYGQLNAAIASVGTGGTGGTTLITQPTAGTGDLLVGSAVAGTHVNFANSAGAARELINVAAGTKDTSAVNLSQLAPVVAGLGGGAGIDAAGKVTGPAYTIQKSTFNNAGDAFNKIDGSLTNLTSTVDAITAETGKGLVAQDATTGNIMVGSLTGGDVVDMTGTAGARKITGVAAGSLDVSSLDAINGSQLNSATSQMATAIGGGMQVDSKTGAITMPAFSVGGNTVYNVGDAITNLDGRTTSNANNLIQLQDQVTNITAGGGVATPNAVAYDTAAHDKLTLVGTDGGNTKLTGLQDGDLSNTSTDAVTGKQLNATNAEVASLSNTVQNIASTGTTTIGINGKDGVAGTAGAAGANGADAIAMGDNASASGDHAVVIGGGATGTADGVVVIGGNAGASGKDSVAIGNGATAPANNAVALGANSVADRDNTVSMGSEGNERQVTNVAAGTRGTDAVNLNQMNSALGGVARKAYSGIAAATALTMIPDVDANKTLSIGIGGGTFQGYAATAIGGTARITQNIKVRVGAGWSAAGTTVGAGASYQW